MADSTTTTSTSSTTFLAFILGAVVLALGIFAYLYFGGDVPAQDEPDITIELPDLPRDNG